MKEESQKVVDEYKARAQPDPPSEAGNDNEDVSKAHESTKEKGLLSYLLKDKDRTIILSLIVLLMDEGGDHSLMLALLYLLM